MTSTTGKHDLEQFQDSGDINSLLRFVRAEGKDQDKYKDAVGHLKLVFDAQMFGVRPIYENLDRVALRQCMAEVTDIVGWMASSDKADLKIRAIELIGFLGWEPFLPLLEQHLASEAKWERLTAISALGQIASARAVTILTAVTDHDPDPEIRTAAQRAIRSKE